METIRTAFQFIISNIWLLVFGGSMLTLTAIFIRKTARELIINRRLFRFQTMLRRKPKHRHGKRTVYLSAIMILPIVLLGTFIVFQRGPLVRYDEYVTRINDMESIMSISDSYYGKFDDHNLYETRLFSHLDESQQSVLNINYQHLTNTDSIQIDGDYLYILNESSITVIDTSNQNLDTVQSIDIPMQTESGQLQNPVALFLYQEHLVVLINVYEGSYRHHALTGIYPQYDKQIETKVLVYSRDIEEIDDLETEVFELIDTYVAQGELTYVHQDTKGLFLALNKIKNVNGLTIEDMLPTLSHNGNLINHNYSDIVYIEGTQPIGFTTLIHIDVSDSVKTDRIIVYGDCTQLFYAGENKVYMLSHSVNFSNASDYLKMPNPVNEVRTSVTQFILRNDGLYHYRTRMIEGEIPSSSAIDYYDGYLRVFTVSELGKYHLNVIDQSMRVSISEIMDDTVQKVSALHYHEHTLYLYSRSLRQLHHVNLENPQDFTVNTVHNHSGLSKFMFVFDDNRAVGIDIFTGIHQHLDTISFKQYHIDDSMPFQVAETVSKTVENYIPNVLYRHDTFKHSQDYQLIAFPLNTLDVTHSSKPKSGLFIYNWETEAYIELMHENESPYSSYQGIFIGDYLYVVSLNYVSVIDVETLQQDNIIELEKK